MADSVERLEFFRLAEADAARVAALERLCFSMPWTEEQFNLSFKQKIFHVFGLQDGEVLVAYCAFYRAGPEMEIMNLAVRPERRRSGAARRLLGLVLQIARKMGIVDICLEVREHNTPAQNLYVGFGFQQVGVRKGYYPDTGEDALLMRLNLT